MKSNFGKILDSKSKVAGIHVLTKNKGQKDEKKEEEVEQYYGLLSTEFD
jgi:hypothetical protein